MRAAAVYSYLLVVLLFSIHLIAGIQLNVPVSSSSSRPMEASQSLVPMTGRVIKGEVSHYLRRNGRAWLEWGGKVIPILLVVKILFSASHTNLEIHQIYVATGIVLALIFHDAIRMVAESVNIRHFNSSEIARTGLSDAGEKVGSGLTSIGDGLGSIGTGVASVSGVIFSLIAVALSLTALDGVEKRRVDQSRRRRFIASLLSRCGDNVSTSSGNG